MNEPLLTSIPTLIIADRDYHLDFILNFPSVFQSKHCKIYCLTAFKNLSLGKLKNKTLYRLRSFHRQLNNVDINLDQQIKDIHQC
jgi:hypothetical protein